MSYLVFARKFRPMTFDEVIDQKHVIITLKNAIQNNRLANAYLFAGPRGVGKTTIARIFAKAINCEQGPTITPCNQCSSCIEITKSRNIDVLEIDGASNNGVENVRNLREKLKYVPSHGKYKIYIIDEVHMLTDSAFNALLKTLEEPPARVMFIFATTEPNKILPTILSRCQRFDFKRITQSEIVSHLRDICKKESIDIDDDALHLIARKADGSMRDGQSLLDQAISFTGNKITGESIASLLGIIDNEIFFKVTNAFKDKDQTALLDIIDAVFVNGFDLNEFLIGLNDHLRNILMTKVTNSTQNLHTTDVYAKRYVSILNDFTESDLLALIKIVSDTEYNIKHSSNPRLKLEISLLKMLNLNSVKNLNDLLDGIHALKDKIYSENISVKDENPEPLGDEKKKIKQVEHSHTVPKLPHDNIKNIIIPTKSEESVDVHISEIKEKWSTFIEEVKKHKIALGSFLNEGEPSHIDGNTVVVSFGSRNGFHIRSVMSSVKLLESILYKLYNKNLHIRCIKGTKPLNGSPEEVDDHSENYLMQLSSKIPGIKTIINVFDGELVR